jgi:hypothetical protein
MVNEFHTLYGTLRFITVLTRASHCTSSSATWIQSTPSPWISHLPHACYMPCPSHTDRSDHSNNPTLCNMWNCLCDKQKTNEVPTCWNAIFKGTEKSDSLWGMRFWDRTLMRGCIQKFPNWVDNEIYTYNNKNSLTSNIQGYGGKTHLTDSQNSDTNAPSGRELYYLQWQVRKLLDTLSHYS